MSISILILTLNEEVNIVDCLNSVQWADDVVILDSFSADSTVTLAEEMGARVVQRAFDDYASQRNFGLQQISYRHPWILMLDADERVTGELRDEMRRFVAAAPANACLMRMRRRDHLFGRWIRRSSGYPTWFGRLVRVGRAWVDRPINEEYKTDGETGMLQAHLDHYPFNKGFHEWIVKHDRYSTLEAQLLGISGASNWSARDLLNREPTRRRAALKGLLYSTPFRPLLVFLALYVIRGGFLEGRAGMTFSLLRAWYEFMIDCKRRELQRRLQGLPV